VFHKKKVQVREFLVRHNPENLILSLDQGTTNSKAFVFTSQGDPVSSITRGLKQQYPSPGWVEQDPELIWKSIIQVARKAISNSRSSGLSCIAITNQRETTILWDKSTLKPVTPAIVWQDRRSSKICENLRASGYSNVVWDRTGLVIDPYFSATKLIWLFEKYPKLRKRAEAGEIYFGTVDSCLLAHLTDGAVHATDFSNASRTMLFDINKLEWDQELLRLFKIPPQILPEAKPSSCIFGETESKYFGRKLPIAAMIGDQQASLFGQAIFKPGMAKNTYGTGCFLLSLSGNQRIDDQKRHLISTIAWGIGSEVTYALEGSVLTAGSVLQWLKDGLGINTSSSNIRKASTKLGDNDDVYFVPALSGLGAPIWDPRARGTIIGITAGTTRNHLLGAALESICYQCRDVILALEETTAKIIQTLRVDGGASTNDGLMQFQSDVLGKEVQRPRITETTALGASLLAGLTMGRWKGLDEIAKSWELGKMFSPQMTGEKRAKLWEKWRDAVTRAKSWARD